MVELSSTPDVEKDLKDESSAHHDQTETLSRNQHTNISYITPFAGRIGGNQAFILDRDKTSDSAVLQDVPDAAPGMTLGEHFNLRPFRNISLRKAAFMEGMGQDLLDINYACVTRCCCANDNVF